MSVKLECANVQIEAGAPIGNQNARKGGTYHAEAASEKSFAASKVAEEKNTPEAHSAASEAHKKAADAWGKHDDNYSRSLVQLHEERARDYGKWAKEKDFEQPKYEKDFEQPKYEKGAVWGKPETYAHKVGDKFVADVNEPHPALSVKKGDSVTVSKVDWSSTFGRPAYTLKDEKGNELVSYDSNIRSGYKKVPSSLKSSHFQNP